MKRLVLLIAPIIILSCSTEENKTLIVDKEVEDVFKRNVKYWSDSNYDKITEEVYASPMAIYLRDSTIMLNSKAEVKNYLISTFDELERNNYGFSKRNKWNYFRKEKNIAYILRCTILDF